MTQSGDSKLPMVVASVNPTGAGSHASSAASPSPAGAPVAVVATDKPCVGSAHAPQITNDAKTPPVESKKRPVPTAASDSSNGDSQPEPRKAARTLFPAEDFEAAKTKIAEQAATIADLESSLSLEAGMHQVAASKVAGLEAQIGAMSVYEGSLLREKNGIAVELGTVQEKLRRVENEKKGIREAQHKLFQARDKERELVLKEVRWLEILAADILKESVPRSVLDNSIWAIIARFKSLQTRAQAEMATARARAASQVIVLQ